MFHVAGGGFVAFHVAGGQRLSRLSATVPPLAVWRLAVWRLAAAVRAPRARSVAWAHWLLLSQLRRKGCPMLHI